MGPQTATTEANPARLGVSVQCRRCGFDLRGLPLDGACPECGLHLASSVPSEVLAAVDPRALVGTDRPCAVCGYNIRGLPIRGHCPECGAAVEQSLLGRLLRFASPAYVAALHRGSFLVELAICLSIGLIVLGVLAGGFWSSFSPMGGAPGGVLGHVAMGVVTDGLFTALSVLGLIGWWMLSAPDPGEPPGAPGRRARSVLRVGVIAQLTAAFGSMVLGAVVAVVNASAGTTSALLGSATVLDLVGGIAWVVSFFAGMAFIRHLAARVPDDRLARRASTLRTFGVVLIACLGALLAAAVLVFALASSGTPVAVFGGFLGLATCFGFPLLGLATFVAFIMYILLIDQLRAVLRLQRAAAGSQGTAPMPPQRTLPPQVH